MAPSSTHPSMSPYLSYSPTEMCSLIEITVVHDEYPDDKSWDLQRMSKNGDCSVLESDELTHLDSTSDIDSMCLHEGEYDFVIYDSVGGDICCFYRDGHYNVVTSGGVLIAK